MTRFTLIHTLAQQRRARDAERALNSHVEKCITCRLMRPCADRKVLELAHAMHESTPIAQ